MCWDKKLPTRRKLFPLLTELTSPGHDGVMAQSTSRPGGWARGFGVLSVLGAALVAVGGCGARENGDAGGAPPLYRYEERRFRVVAEQPATAAPELRLRVEPQGGWKLSPRYPAGLAGESSGASAPLRLAAADALRLDEQALEFALPRLAGGPESAASGRLAGTLSFAVSTLR